jgi:hypothetical protein
MPRIVKGHHGPVRQPFRITYDPNTGHESVILYEASPPESIFGVTAGLETARIAYEIESDGAKAVLRAVTSRLELQPDLEETPIDKWEILANEIQKDLFEHPSAALIPDTELRAIRDAIQSPVEDQSPALTTASAIDLYSLLLRGTTHYTVGQYVVRHTRTVSDRYTRDLADVDVGLIYTTGQLISEATGSSLQTPMPLRMRNKLNNIAEPAFKSGFVWGWLKRPATEVTVANNKIEVSSEWWLEQWSTFIYGTR